jgi:hypothetical protein
VFSASRLDWVMLIRAVPTAMAMATGAEGRTHPEWLAHVVRLVGLDVSPWVRLAAAVAAVILCVLGAWTVRRPRAERPAVEAVATT